MQGLRRAIPDDSGGVGDDEDESLEVLPTPPHQRRVSKRKASHILQEGFHHDDVLDGGADELRAVSPELEEISSPAKKTKPNGSKPKGKASQHNEDSTRAIRARNSPVKRKSALRNTSKGGKSGSKGKNVRVQASHDLQPETPISELNLDEAIETLLDECEIKTLEDLRDATRGDTNYFDSGTDIPLEDFLSFMQQRLHHYARGTKGFQYDWNREDQDLDAEEASLEEQARKSKFLQDGVKILRASRVLARALRAIQW